MSKKYKIVSILHSRGAAKTKKIAEEMAAAMGKSTDECLSILRDAMNRNMQELTSATCLPESFFKKDIFDVIKRRCNE